jgi:hypothetical protein
MPARKREQLGGGLGFSIQRVVFAYKRQIHISRMARVALDLDRGATESARQGFGLALKVGRRDPDGAAKMEPEAPARQENPGANRGNLHLWQPCAVRVCPREVELLAEGREAASEPPSASSVVMEFPGCAVPPTPSRKAASKKSKRGSSEHRQLLGRNEQSDQGDG